MPGQRTDLAPDAGMQEIMARMVSPAAPSGSVGLEVAGGLEIHLGRIATLLEAEHSGRARRRAELSAAIFPFDFNPVLMSLSGGAGTADINQALGVRDGFAVDFKRFTFASFTAGTVALYKQGVADMDLIQGGFTAGTLYGGSQDLLLQPSERWLVVATGITGNVTISGSGIMIRQDFLAEYLL